MKIRKHKLGGRIKVEMPCWVLAERWASSTVFSLSPIYPSIRGYMHTRLLHQCSSMLGFSHQSEPELAEFGWSPSSWEPLLTIWVKAHRQAQTISRLIYLKHKLTTGRRHKKMYKLPSLTQFSVLCSQSHIFPFQITKRPNLSAKLSHSCHKGHSCDHATLQE